MSNKLIGAQEIQERLKEIGNNISINFNEVTLLVTLTGGVYTAVDLSKYITIPCKMEFVKISSYGHAQEAGIVDLKWMSAERGENLGNVIIVDDVFDTGNTMDYLVKYLKNNYKFESLNTMVLLDKPSRRQKPMDITYIGFTIEDKFVYGYGLDLKDYDRNLVDVFEFVS